MAGNTPGFSFAPTFDNAEMAQHGAPGGQSQDPLQTLSFRLPKFKPGGISPMQGQQQIGSGISSAVLDSVLRTVLGAERMAALSDGSPDPAMGIAPPSASPRPIGQPGRDPGVMLPVPSRSPGAVIRPGHGPTPVDAPSFGEVPVPEPPPMEAAPSFGPRRPARRSPHATWNL